MVGPSGTERRPEARHDVDEALGESDELHLTRGPIATACGVEVKVGTEAGRGECIGVLHPHSSVI